MFSCTLDNSRETETERKKVYVYIYIVSVSIFDDPMMYTNRTTQQIYYSTLFISMKLDDVRARFWIYKKYIEHAIQTFHTSRVANKQVQIFTMICRQNPLFPPLNRLPNTFIPQIKRIKYTNIHICRLYTFLF